MPFTVFAAADIYGQKVNLELTFPLPPTLADLHTLLTQSFSNECVVLRPAGRPLQSFGVERVQSYNEATGAWDEITGSHQIQEFAQLYVLQSDPLHRESQEQIQPARRPSPRVSGGAGGAVMGSPAPVSVPRGGALPSGVNVSINASHHYHHNSSVVGSSAPATHLSTLSPPRSAAAAAAAASVHRTAALAATASAAATTTAAALNAIAAANSHNNIAAIVALPPIPRGAVPAAPSQSDKIRFLLSEMDTNGNGVIEPSEFQELLRYLNVDFSNATISDLFRKADADRDGVLSGREFAAFFSTYVTLLDAMFYRLRDLAELRALQLALAQEHEALTAARDRADRASAVSAEMARALDQQRAHLVVLEQQFEAVLARDAQARNALRQAAEDVLAAQSQRVACQQELHVQTERESAQAQAAAMAQQDAAEADRRAVQHQALLQAAEDKVRQLQALLLEAQRDAARLSDETRVMRDDAVRMRDREAAAQAHLQSAQRDTSRARETLAIAERELIARSDVQRDAKRGVDDAQAEVAQIRRAIDDQKRDTALAQDRDAEAKQLATDSAAAAIAQERRVMARDAEIRAFAQQRRQLEDQERPLLEQEVRLREQRDSLEEKEIRHRRETTSLFDTTLGTRGPIGSPARISSPLRR
jgi:hypothetical protein